MKSLVESILACGYRAAVVTAGGGSGAVHAVLSYPGASRFVLEAQVPYSPEAMFDFLGEKLESFCSVQAAVTMAGRAFERALIFSMTGHSDAPIAGIACTAALQTTRERRGSDRAFACIKTRRAETVRELVVPPGTRQEQEAAVSRALLEFMDDFFREHSV